MIKSLITEINKFNKDELEELEKYDSQYQSLQKMFNSLQNKEQFLKLAITNALLSYQLSMKWEKYWELFWEYFKNWTNNIIEDFKIFLNTNNKRFLKAKLKRLNKISVFINQLNLSKLEYYQEHQIEFLNYLAWSMKQWIHSKTIVFCIKIFIWCSKIIWKDITANTNIFIPLDSRLSKISTNKQDWIEISKKTWFSLIILDTLFYLSIWWNIDKIENYKLKNKIIAFRNKIYSYINN